MKNAKIDLSLLKKLVDEVENELTVAETVAAENASTQEVPVDFVIALSKLSGLLASTAQESTMLVADVQKLIRYNSAPSPKGGLSSLEALLSGIKGDPNDPGDIGGGSFN